MRTDTVTEDADYLSTYTNKDLEKLCQALEGTHKVDSFIIVPQVVEMTARKNYQTVKQGSFGTLRHTLKMVEQQL
jgi:hypothetical protein